MRARTAWITSAVVVSALYTLGLAVQQHADQQCHRDGGRVITRTVTTICVADDGRTIQP